MLICVTFSLPSGVGGWLRLLLVALPGLFCLHFFMWRSVVTIALTTHQIHTYLIISCINDVSVKSDLKFYFMGICKDVNTNFCHLYIFQSKQKRKKCSGLTLY